VNSKLKNIIKKIILKEADDYLQDFSSFGDEEKKRDLRNYITSKNLSNSTIGPKSLTNFPNKGDDLSLFSVNIKDLNPVQRNMLKQSLNNGNIQHKIESGVVSFSTKDFYKIKSEVIKLIEDEYEHAQELYKDYFLKNGDNDFATGNVKPNEKTKRYEQKLFFELEKVQNIANNLFQIIVNTIDNNYNDRSIDEAYIDAQGELGDFDFFPYNIKTSDDTSPLYNPSLPRRNRYKAPDGGVYLELIVDDPYQREVLQRVLKIAVDKGRNMSDLGGSQKLRGFKYKMLGHSLKVEFSSKYQQLMLNVLEEIRRDDLIKLKEMQDSEYDMNEYEKEEQLKIFNQVFKSLINSIR
jgi:hypothetical protein